MQDLTRKSGRMWAGRNWRIDGIAASEDVDRGSKLNDQSSGSFANGLPQLGYDDGAERLR